MVPVSATPKVTIFQHAGNEPAGLLETILAENNVDFAYNRLYETNEVLYTGASHLIFLGGPMSVNDEKELPWLIQEKALIRNSVRQGIPVLGICLGAQLIAGAFGARVYRSVTENGWRRVRTVGTGTSFHFPPEFSVFQLHGETFDIPPGGSLLCTGNEVRNQAFMIGSALGLQFHLEPTEGMIRNWSENLSPEERAAVAVDTPRCLDESNALCRALADDFLRRTFR